MKSPEVKVGGIYAYENKPRSLHLHQRMAAKKPERAEPASVGWHVTARHNRESILAHGLRLSPPMTTEQFNGTKPCWLWLFVDEDVARAAATKSWDCSRGDNDVWEVDLSGYALWHEFHDGWGDSQPGWDDAIRVVTRPVPPERLRLPERVPD